MKSCFAKGIEGGPTMGNLFMKHGRGARVIFPLLFQARGYVYLLVLPSELAFFKQEINHEKLLKSSPSSS